MSYSREQVKAITDKILNMCKADAVEVEFSGGERSATRYANSTITANLVEHDQQVEITVYFGQKSASTTTHQFDDASLKAAIEQVQTLAQRKPDNPETMPLVKPPQDYLIVEAALPSAVNFGPAERAQMVKKSVEICEKKGVRRRRLHPEVLLDAGDRQFGRAVRVLPVGGRQLHPDLPHAGRHGIGLGRHDQRQGHLAD